MTTSRPRLRLGGAIIALLAIAAAAVALFAMRPVSTDTTFARGHDHEAVAPAPAVTAEQQARADELVAATSAALAPFADVSAAEAAGYRWIGDGQGAGEYRHYVQGRYLLDDTVLDPDHVESLVYRERTDGSLELVSGMFILPPGSGLEDIPDIAGDLTPWHEHTNLCWSGRGEIVGTDDSGRCPDGSFNATTPPMLHVWVVDNPDGPFAAIDENGVVGAAAHTH